LLKLEAQPAAVSNGFFNHLSMIYKMEQLASDMDDPNYNFMVGTNNGIAILLISKNALSMTLSKESYLAGKVVNNFLTRGPTIIACVHNDDKFYLVDRKTREVTEVAWPLQSALCCTGLQWAPGFHPREMSFFFVRGANGIHLVNTQTWHVTTLINMSEGAASFPDLSLLLVEAGDDHSIVIYTLDKFDKVLVRHSYSHMLKFCVQTASVRASQSKAEMRRKCISV